MTIAVVLFIFAGIIIQAGLALRQINYVHSHRVSVPLLFQSEISLSDHQKAADYAIAKTYFSVIEWLVVSISFLMWILGGCLNLLNSVWVRAEFNSITTGLCFLLSLLLIQKLIKLPLSLYQTFGIERRFAFNNLTPRLFFLDFIKNIILSSLLVIPFATLALWSMTLINSLYWWISIWGLGIFSALLVAYIHPLLIAPLFNKFRPLTDDKVIKNLYTMITRCGFSTKGIFTMDNSRRSHHSNAYFTGFGKNKRIVLFDTLIDKLTPDEISAVLAHELGHLKYGHTLKFVLLLGGVSLISLWLFNWGHYQIFSNPGLEIQFQSGHMTLALLFLFLPMFRFFLNPLLTFIRRQYEFEADSFALKYVNARILIRSLTKLYRDNASILSSDPWHSAWYDSHPQAQARISRIHAQSIG